MAKSVTANNDEYRSTVERAMEELRLKTSAHEGLWQLGQADWSVDQDQGEVYFTAPSGVVATCPVQIVGTYDTVNGTWLWGWDHPAVHEALQEHAKRVKEYGHGHGISDLTTRKLSCTEHDAWEFTALACHLAEAQGAYRAPTGVTLVFMTFGTVSLTKPE